MTPTTLHRTTPTTTRKTPAQIEDGRIQLHRDLTDILRNKTGLRDPYASDMAADILSGLEEAHGGSELYIYAPDKRARDSAIRAEFNGTNGDAVCKKHGVSRTRMYEIVGQKP